MAFAGAALLALLAAAPAAEETRAPAAQEGWFLSSDGTRLFYRKVGRGPAAVFVPGPPEDFRGFAAALAPLADGRAVVFYDARGTGLSQRVTDPGRLTMDDHVRDLEALRAHLGVRRLPLVAHGAGAALAALYARAHPTRVDRLLLVAPIPPAGTAAVEPAVEPAPDAAAAGDIPPSALANRTVVRAAAAASLGAWDFRPWLGRIAAPVLVVEGAQWPGLDATREWAAEMPAARLLAVPGAGRPAMAGDAVLGAARQFLGGRFPAGAELVGEADAH